MKTKIQHILIGGIVTVAMAAASTAQANVGSTATNVARYSSQASLVGAYRPVANPTANRSLIKLAQKKTQKISAKKAKKIARSKVKGGEVVDLALKKSTYKVRVIGKNGKVVDVLIDANSGRVK